MQVATTTPQTSRGFLAVGQDMAKILAVVALRKASLSCVRFYLDNNMVKDIQFLISEDFTFLVKVRRFVRGFPSGVFRWVLFDWPSFASS
jgi:hypothetical protein